MIREISYISINALLLLLVSVPANANPGAWVMEQGKGQIINNLSYYSSKHRFNNAGNRVAQPSYYKIEINPYVEYGMWEHTTIGANAFMSRASSNNQTNYGIGDVEVFSRTRVWHNDRAVISIQPMIKISGIYERKNAPKIGSDEMDVGIAALGGINYDVYGFPQYAEVEIGQRTRFGTPENQYIINGTIGTRVLPDVQLLTQVFNTIRAADPTIATFTESPADDYDLTKVQMSAVYHYNEQFSFQAGGFYNVTGTNAGNGGGVMLALWTRF